MVQYVLKRVFSKGQIAFELPDNPVVREAIKQELKRCRDKNNDYVLLTLQPPKKPRTTGPHSQNHHLNGHLMQLCEVYKCSYEAMKYTIKRLAAEQLGYPYELIGEYIWPQKESECSTEDCAKLIEACHLFAADNNIRLRE